MRSFFMLALLAPTLLSAFLGVQAMPIADDSEDDICVLEDFIEARSLSGEFEKRVVGNAIAKAIVAAMPAVAKAATKPAIFYSGFTTTKGNSARKSVKVLRATVPGETLDDVLRRGKKEGHFTVDTLKGIPRADVAQICATWAKTCHGTVHAILGKTLPPNSIWAEYEKPALLENKEVKEVLQHMVDTTGKLEAPTKIKGE